MIKTLLILCSCLLPGLALAVESNVEARVGKPATSDGLRVLVKKVVEDSRCPQDVQCVWQGRLVIEAQLKGKGGTETVQLASDGGEKRFQDWTVSLAEATPWPAAGRKKKTAPRAYRFRFVIKRG